MRLGHHPAADAQRSHFHPPPERVFADTDAAIPLLEDIARIIHESHSAPFLYQLGCYFRVLL